MRFVFRALRACLLFALAGAALGSVWAQDMRSGTLKSVTGEVHVTKGQERRDAKSGGGVAETDRLMTGTDGIAVMTLRDGTQLTVGPNSQVDLTRFQFDSTTQTGSLGVRVVLGTIRMVTGVLGKLSPENVKVTTPSSTVSVRGTDFIVEVL
ncbi:MAG: hypothetical protein RL032_923 [Pseudomonadota bacterium]|jgi:hypothetical protein